MIRYSHDNNKNGLSELCLSGDVSTLTADVMLLISLVYGSIYQKNEGCAHMFKKNMETLCNDENIRKMVFSDDLIEAADRTFGEKKAEDKKGSEKEHEDKKADEEQIKEDLRKLIKELLDL